MAAAEELLAAGADFEPVPYAAPDVVSLHSLLPTVSMGRKARHAAQSARDKAVAALIEESPHGGRWLAEDLTLLDRGFQRVTSSTTYLHEAARQGFADLIRFALQRARVAPDTALPTYWRETPLYVAVSTSHARAVRELVAAGEFVYVAYPSQGRFTPRHGCRRKYFAARPSMHILIYSDDAAGCRVEAGRCSSSDVVICRHCQWQAAPQSPFLILAPLAQFEHHVHRRRPGGRLRDAEDILQVLSDAGVAASETGLDTQRALRLRGVEPAFLLAPRTAPMAIPAGGHGGAGRELSSMACPAFKAGTCTRGPACAMRHELCTFHSRPGGCRYGAACFYRHEAAAPLSSH